MSTYFIGDTQRTYDETEAFVHHANGRDDIDFVIHGGDYTEFGMTKEFAWAVERLNQLRVPYAGLIGNHDILGNGHEVYAELFGVHGLKRVTEPPQSSNPAGYAARCRS